MVRAVAAEQALRGQKLNRASISSRSALRADVSPIDDIRFQRALPWLRRARGADGISPHLASDTVEFLFMPNGIPGSEERSRMAEGPDAGAVPRAPRAWHRAGGHALLVEHRPGTFKCAGCGQPLFVTDCKFESDRKVRPSFFAPLEGATATSTDCSFFMTRTEVHCSRCGRISATLFQTGRRQRPPRPHQRHRAILRTGEVLITEFCFGELRMRERFSNKKTGGQETRRSIGY